MRKILLMNCLLASLALCSNGQHGETPGQSAVIIFRGADGRALTMDDLRGLSGTFQYEIVGHFNVPTAAESLHDQARQAGELGDYKTAITLLEQAHNLAPQWPYPVYDMAFTYLLMKETENARTYYRKTVELSPRGFFEAITAADALDREQKGELPTGTYLKYLSLEWTADRGKKTKIVHQLVTEAPGFAPGWKEIATLSKNDDERLAAIERGLAAHPDRETKGIMQINEALILHRKGDREGAIRLLGELALDPASTYATEHMAKVSLANLVKK
jgi:tetratricopeptide (TPR) repeat protein